MSSAAGFSLPFQCPASSLHLKQALAIAPPLLQPDSASISISISTAMWRTITCHISTRHRIIRRPKQKQWELVRTCSSPSPRFLDSRFLCREDSSAAARGLNPCREDSSAAAAARGLNPRGSSNRLPNPLFNIHAGGSLAPYNHDEIFSAIVPLSQSRTTLSSKRPFFWSGDNHCSRHSIASDRFVLYSPLCSRRFDSVSFGGDNLGSRKTFGSSAQAVPNLAEAVAEDSIRTEGNHSLQSGNLQKRGRMGPKTQHSDTLARKTGENPLQMVENCPKTQSSAILARKTRDEPLEMAENPSVCMTKTDNVDLPSEHIADEECSLRPKASEMLLVGTNNDLSLSEVVVDVNNGNKSNNTATDDFSLQMVNTGEKRCYSKSSGLPSPQAQSRVNGRKSKIMSKEEDAAAARNQKLYTQRMRRKQRKMEMEAYWRATLEYKNMVVRMCKKKLAPNVPFVRGLLLSWFEPYRDALLEEQKAILGKEHLLDRNVYGPFLLQLPADILAVVVMHKLMSVLMKEQEQGYVRLLTVASAVGEAVEQEAEIFRIMMKRKRKRRRSGSSPNTREEILQFNLDKLIKKQNVILLEKILKKERVSKPWGSPVQVKVGSRLVDILMNVAFIHPPASQSSEDDSPEVRPALKHEHRVIHSTRKRPSRSIGVLTCDPLVWSTLEKSARFVEMPYMPMLVEPVKWTSYKKGGYMVLRSRLMRTHGTRSQQLALTRTSKAQLKKVFEALDVLGRTPWRINVKVLTVVEKMWSDGGCLGGLVERNHVELPKRPNTTDEQEIRNWRREVFKKKRINSERHSQCCDVELKLSVARKYKNEMKFYFPHNLDFRGRAYPMHPYLNHLGSDLCRGLLEFGEGRPLGSTGLRWLKIHLANVFAGGVDKLSFSERIAFVDKNIDNIKDSAEKPLEGNRWWLEAEDPFQCLAACMSLRDALESGDVEKYICYTPVQQDGSCNGLQHYAALGRDVVGAESVNLVAGDRPADVYSVIADRVRQIVERDANNGPSTCPVADCARALVGHVDRKLVKQTVMTSVYGVTFVGARAQILNRLEEKAKEPDDSQLFPTSSYAAKMTLEALGEMFKEAKSIMNWLAECAKLVASKNEAVKWSSPLGLPVVQPYRKPGWKQVKTSLQTFTLRNDNDQPVFVQRQKSAFPPNFVHSLDSTHMMMTAIACGEAGLLFAGVHDSFWTHAADVEKMNQILRETFVELYKQPILEDLLKSFQKNFPGIECPPIPERGNFELDKILTSPYFFN